MGDAQDRAQATLKFWEKHNVGGVPKTVRANVKGLAAAVKTPFKSPVATHTRAATVSNKERMAKMDADKTDSNVTRRGRSTWQFIFAPKARDQKLYKTNQQPYYGNSTFKWCKNVRTKFKNLKDWSDVEDMMIEMFDEADIDPYVDQPDLSKLPDYESTEVRQKYDYLRGSGATVTDPRPLYSGLPDSGAGGAEIEPSQLSSEPGVLWSNEGDAANVDSDYEMEIKLPESMPFPARTPMQGGILAERLEYPEVGGDGFPKTPPEFDDMDPSHPEYIENFYKKYSKEMALMGIARRLNMDTDSVTPVQGDGGPVSGAGGGGDGGGDGAGDGDGGSGSDTQTDAGDTKSDQNDEGKHDANSGGTGPVDADLGDPNMGPSGQSNCNNAAGGASGGPTPPGGPSMAGGAAQGVVNPTGNKGQFGFNVNKTISSNPPFTMAGFDKDGKDTIGDVPAVDNAQGNLRPRFGMMDAASVIPSAKDQIKSDLRFDMFDTVNPGFGEGADNKLYLMETNRDEKIIFSDPMFSPGSNIGPESGVGVSSWKLQRTMPTEKMAEYSRSVQTNTQLIASLVNSGVGSSNVLGDDVGYYSSYSSKGLKRKKMSPFEPVINNSMQFHNVKTPCGAELNQYKSRYETDSMRYPRHLSSFTNGRGGPTLGKRRSLEIILQ